MERTQTNSLGAPTVLALIASVGSIFIPLVGNLAAIGMVLVASRLALSERDVAGVRVAAVVTAAVAVLHLAFFVYGMPVSFEAVPTDVTTTPLFN